MNIASKPVRKNLSHLTSVCTIDERSAAAETGVRKALQIG